MILSVCIPTYNRSAYLGKFLSELYSQISECGLLGEIEVIVSDNASQDDTCDICSVYKEKGLIYSKNPENIGPDANFLKLFEMASGEYIWLPGDDDLFVDGFVKYLVDAVKKEEFDYFFLRTTDGANSDDLYEVVSSRELFSRATIFTTFMTSQVIRSSLIKDKIESARSYLGGYMAYYYIFCSALGDSRKCLISNRKKILIKVENTGGYSFYKVWGEHVFEALAGAGVFKEYVNRFRLDMFITLIASVTYRLRLGGVGFNFEDKALSFDLGKNFPGFFYAAMFLIYRKSPVSFLRVFHTVVRVANKVRRMTVKAVC